MAAASQRVTWTLTSGGQPLVRPASLCRVLKLSQLRISVVRLGEDDAVVQPGGLALPELHQERLDDVAAPVNTDRTVSFR